MTPVGKDSKYNYLDMDADIWVEHDVEDDTTMGEIIKAAIAKGESRDGYSYSRLVLQNHGHYVYIYRRTNICTNHYSIRRADDWEKKRA